jgi:WXG100 family type VII secretion target
MGRKVQLNYDELRTVVKKFRNEGEDTVRLHSTMRDRVHDLHKDWAGEGADKFFKEMENDLLPALLRLSSALFYAQDVLHKIIQIIQTFDEDTAGYFKMDFAQLHPINLGAFLAGAGLGVGVGSMAGGPSSGGLSGVGGPADSIGGTGQPVPNSQPGSDQAGFADQAPGPDGQSPGAGAGSAPGTQTAGVSAGAGDGGSGGSSQGVQGNQQGMAGGVGAQVGGGAGVGSLGGGSMAADHIYEDSSGVGAGGSSAQTGQASGSSGGGAQGTTGGDGTVAAGAAGVAGSAAIGAAGKSIKGRLRKKKR